MAREEPEAWVVTLLKGAIFGSALGAGAAGVSRFLDRSRYRAVDSAMKGDAKRKLDPIPAIIASDEGMLWALKTIQEVRRARPTIFRQLLFDIQNLMELYLDCETLDHEYISVKLINTADAIRTSIHTKLRSFLSTSHVPLVSERASEFYGQPVDEELRESIQNLMIGIDSYVNNVTIEVETKLKEKLERTQHVPHLDR